MIEKIYFLIFDLVLESGWVEKKYLFVDMYLWANVGWDALWNDGLMI